MVNYLARSMPQRMTDAEVRLWVNCDAWLATQGYSVLRFENYHVLTHTDEIVQHIVAVATERAARLRGA